MNMRTLLGASALASTLVLMPVAAFAQTAASGTTATQPQEDAATDPNIAERSEQAAGDVIVTGSRLARPNLDSPTPVTSVTAELLTSTGNLNLGDSLNQLPALRTTYSQANSTRFIGTSGLNLLDLRGLGTQRTLVVVNGRRHVTAQPGSFVIDTNTIPTDLLERVDVVTGGSSAVYGSDAMAGVVNFVLKRDFEGLRATGQSGISSHGTRGSYFGALTAGKNFAEGRGNIAASAEYSFSDVVYFTDRDDITGAFSGRRQFNAVQNTGPQLNPNGGVIRTGGEPSTGDGIPDTNLLSNIRNGTISEGGMFASSCPTVAATGESAAAFAARRTFTCTGIANVGSSNALAQYGRNFAFNPDGTLTANNCITDLRPASTNCVGGRGSTLRLLGMLQPRMERASGNLLAHFDISDAFKPFVEVKYVRIKSLQEGQPTFATNTFSINNPYLTDQARSTLQQALAPGATTFTAQRFNVDFGGRGEDHTRETFRIVGGVEGDFGQGWHYEVSANYGRLDTFYRTAGNYVTQKYNNSINAVRNAAGQIVCGINADASTANDDAACVPVNLFGQGQVSQAALNYFSVTSTRKQKAEQFDLLGFVNGKLFRLPGGDVTFSLGGEYRRETAYSKYDDLTASGATFLNAIPTFAPPAYDIKEAFGELSVPLLADRPFFHELTLTGAARVSHYNVGNAGTPWTYNLNAIWSPIRDITIRGGYARSVRAPSLGELFTANNQTFAQPSDPCSQNNINNNPNRARNCAAAGVPTTQTFNGTTEPFTNGTAASIAGVNRGNPNLNAEKSNSFTIGAVFQPQAIRGLSFTVDYYNITIKDAIVSLAAQTLINQCYDNPSGINNQYCAAVIRNPNGTFAGQSSVIHAGTTIPLTPTGPSFFSQGFNFAKLETSGIDFDLSYRTKISDTGTLSLRVLASYVAQNNAYTDVADPNFRDRYKSELGYAAWRGQFVGNLNFETFDLQYRLRYEGKSTIAAEYETQNSYDGRPARNPDAFPMVYYPEAFYHSVQVGFNATDRFRFYVGVDNLTDVKPPYDLIGTASGDPYDNIGRFFYAGFKANF
ncbi:putative TonB-dependent receptor [Sphingomonas parapaucimobilis NBRC 15100]|uniref:Putative TonB-dependent receptor n=2 Tax=Sphingomonas parapaucimobilis TaxID=28213 RepID=A0A0A1W4S2_9SPHN|nr:putative TonB-dependent receptor [Sphingomonas parapaucimobilis NBRC 15100]